MEVFHHPTVYRIALNAEIPIRLRVTKVDLIQRRIRTYINKLFHFAWAKINLTSNVVENSFEFGVIPLVIFIEHIDAFPRAKRELHLG